MIRGLCALIPLGAFVVVAAAWDDEKSTAWSSSASTPQVIRRVFDRISPSAVESERRCALCDAGKTTILYYFAHGDVVSAVPTVGFNAEGKGGRKSDEELFLFAGFAFGRGLNSTALLECGRVRAQRSDV